jgi:hypothetical protein
MRQPRGQRYALINTKQRVSAQRGRASCRFGCQRVGCDRISLPRNPQGRKIATNNFGIREMSGLCGRSAVRFAAKLFCWSCCGTNLAANLASNIKEGGRHDENAETRHAGICRCCLTLACLAVGVNIACIIPGPKFNEGWQRTDQRLL